jgi:hypothetical protein
MGKKVFCKFRRRIHGVTTPLVFMSSMPPVRNRYCDRRAEIYVNSESCEIRIKARNMFPSSEPAYPCCGLVCSYGRQKGR